MPRRKLHPAQKRARVLWRIAAGCGRDSELAMVEGRFAEALVYEQVQQLVEWLARSEWCEEDGQEALSI